MNKAEFLQLLPRVVSNDKSLYALAVAVANLLSEQYDAIDSDRLYDAIDRLPEPILDILAKDFKVDWWSPNYTLEEKRATIKSSWKIHKRLGTVKAVTDAISDIYEDTTLEEWFEYGAEPYHFKLVVNSNDKITDYDKLITVIDRIKYYKNVRSAFDKIEFSVSEKTQQYIGLALQCGEILSIANVPWIDPNDEQYLVGTDEAILYAENGFVLFV